MRKIVKEMIKIYQLKEMNVCFMGYKLDEKASYHHIIKKEHGGKANLKNGAVINDSAHNYLHIIEAYDYELFAYINAILLKENQQGCLSIQNLRTINHLLTMFEKKYSHARSSKGKILIKEEYLQRRIR